MQFIVKPQKTALWTFSHRDLERKGTRVLLILALVGCFSTGLLIGCLSNLDAACLSRGFKESTVNTLFIDTQDYKKNTFLMILILSSKDYLDRRNAIRETWLKLGGERKMKYFFVIGGLELTEIETKLLNEENHHYQDLLIFPQVKDTYSGLSHKLLASLKWSISNFTYSALLKIDDDSFVKLDTLFDELASKKELSNLYWGYFTGNSQVKKTGQWSEKNWFLCDKYIPYAVGGGYIISSDLVDYINSNAHMLKVYVSEDVTMGTWLAPLEISRQHDTRFDTWYKSRGCSNDFLIMHKQSPHELRMKYKTLEETGRLCREESYSNGYEYNWKAVPSKCCQQNKTKIYNSVVN